MASAARRSTGNSLLRVAQACETLLAGFNSGQAAAVRSCLVSREHAVSLGERSAGGGVGDRTAGTPSTPSELLLPLEDAMAHRRARPSLLLPAWRAIGFAVGTGTATLLPPEQSARVGASIARAVTEQYDANIRSLYDAKIAEEEIEVKELFKAQRDEPSRAAFVPGIGDAAGGGGGGGVGGGSGSDAPTADTNSSNNAGDAPSMAVTGTLKSALRMACTVTSKL